MSEVEVLDALWTGEPSDDPVLERMALTAAARSMIVARRALEGPLPVDLIADPVVDVLMALYVAASDDRTLSAAELERGTSVSPSVTRRWLAALAQYDLVDRDDTGVSLTAAGETRVAEAIRAVIRSQVALHAGNGAG